MAASNSHIIIWLRRPLLLLLCTKLLNHEANAFQASSFSPRHHAQQPWLAGTSPTRKAAATSTNSIASDDTDDATTSTSPSSYLTTEQLTFVKSYLNEHHQTDVLIPFVKAFTELGAVFRNKNMWMANSYSILTVNITDVTSSCMTLQVATQEQGKGQSMDTVEVSLDASPIDTRNYVDLPKIQHFQLQSIRNNGDDGSVTTILPIDDFVRRVNRLCNIVKAYKATGKIIQMGVQLGGAGVGKLNNDMYLNQVPHNRFVRKYFYDMASQAALDATILCSNKQISNRMKMTVLFPEMNPQMDSYRIGTLLELARSIAITLAEQNLRVRVCVQGSMGVGIFIGVPKQLNGVHTLLQRMDWESESGEENEGMVGDYINFGFVGKEHVVNTVDVVGEDPISTKQDDVFLILCPQNMVGLESSIIGPLSEMVDAAGDRPVIIINPDLTDKISSQGLSDGVLSQVSVLMEMTNDLYYVTYFVLFYVLNIVKSNVSLHDERTSSCDTGERVK